MQNGHSKSFEIIYMYFDVFEKPLVLPLSDYNYYRIIICESSDLAKEAKIAIFNHPTLI